MANPNYNLIKFIRRNIYQMKREYGSPIQINILGAIDTDLKTGVKSATQTSYNITRAVVLPVRYKREVIQTISMISANKKFVQGGLFETGTRSFIIDRRDCPALTAINNEDWIVYNGRRYEIKWIDEFEQNTAWLIIGKELEGAQANGDFNETVTSSLAMTDVATPEVAHWFGDSVSSNMALTSVAAATVDRAVSASSTMSLTSVASAVAVATAFLQTTGASTFDPVVTMTSGPAVEWDLGDGNTNTNNSVSHTYANTGDYGVSWDASPTLVEQLDVNADDVTSLTPAASLTNMTVLKCHGNPLTTFTTLAEWVNLEVLFCYSCGLTTLTTHAEWVNLTQFYCRSNSLTTLATHAEWVNLTQFICYDNNLTSLDTHAEWTALTHLSCHLNSLTDLNVFSTWTSIASVRCDTNNLGASPIDDILIALDATGVSGGTLNYTSNPGSADVSRSGAAATAKANLVGNGWVVTI